MSGGIHFLVVLKMLSKPSSVFVYCRDMKKLTISYPCVMLNVDVAKNNTNDQYQVCQAFPYLKVAFVFCLK